MSPRHAPLALLALALSASVLAAPGDVSFSPSPAIGTTVPGTPIATHLDVVKASAPRRVTRRGLTYWESDLRLSGTGFGGQAACFMPSPSCVNIDYAAAPYAYSIDGIVRWPDGGSSTLVTYVHGFTSLDGAQANPPLWRLWAEGDRTSGDGALQNGAAYFAINYSGVNDDGTTSARLLAGPNGGAPVQVWDAPLVRDAARGVEQLLARLTGRSTTLAVLSGHSMGGILTGEVIGGLSRNSLIPGGVREGGNNVAPYDPASPTIFQGAVLMATGGQMNVDPQFPLVPMWTISGEDDYENFGATNAQGDLRWTWTVQQSAAARGEDVRDWISMQQLRDMPHNFPEVWFLGAVPPPPFARMDADRVGPVVSAALRNVIAAAAARRDHASRVPMVASHYGGAGIDFPPQDGVIDDVVYRQRGGARTDQLPLLHDPAIDAFAPDVDDFGPLQPLPETHGQIVRWTAVSASIPPTRGLALPWTSVRLGGYDLDASGATLARPYADLCARYGSAAGWRAQVEARVKQLEREGVYVRPADRSLLVEPHAASLFAQQGC